MNKNDIFEIQITGLTDEGDGVGRVEGCAVFVPYALPGETVRAIIIKLYKSYAIGKLLEILKPCENRTKALCPYFYKCGGCVFWNVDYETELLYKRQKVEDCIRRIGGIHIPIPPVIGAESVVEYRNKGQLPVSQAGIGIYAKHSHRVVDIDRCIIQDSENAAVIRCVREFMQKYGVEAYNEETGNGCIRHIYTRCGDGGRLVCIVTNGKELLHGEQLVEMLRKNVKDIRGVLQNINDRQTNVVLGKQFKTLWGDDFIEDSIGDCKFIISTKSFYQVNKAQTKILYETVKRFADLSGGEIVWDLYCGIGTIGQFVAKSAKKIVGIEVVEAATVDAKENARLNKISNAQYYCGTAEALAPKLKGEKPDVIIIDPPRKGCDEGLLNTIARVGPKRIVYVSCKPSTLARDLKILQQLGYATEKIQPVDLFPRTHHVESVVLLSRKIPDDRIEIDIDLDELDITTAESKATYEEIKDYVLKKYHFKVSSLYIAQIKTKYGIKEAINYNISKKGTRVPQCPPDKEKAITDALTYYGMI